MDERKKGQQLMLAFFLLYARYLSPGRLSLGRSLTRCTREVNRPVNKKTRKQSSSSRHIVEFTVA